MDNQALTQEESYVERRKLFKNIWETAIHIDEKDNHNDVLSKPKVIKTLRLTDIDRSAGKRKKQRIKNLRTVCEKILDFCNRQEADDMFYEQLMIESHGMPQRPQTQATMEEEPDKQKATKNNYRKKKRTNSTKMKIITTDANTPRNCSPDKRPLTTIKQLITNKAIKLNQSSNNIIEANKATAGGRGSHSKIKRYKRKRFYHQAH